MVRYTITYGTLSKILENAPEGWNDQQVSIVRNDRYKGMFREVSANLRFVGDGAKIMKTAFYTEGVEADVTLTIESWNKLTLAWVMLFTGAADFSEVNDSRDFFECPIIDNGLSSLIKANEGVKYSFDFANDTVLKYLGIRLYAATAKWNKAYFQTPMCAYTYHDHSVPMVVVSNVDNTQGGYSVYDIAESTLSPVSFPNTEFFKANRDANVDIDISLLSFEMLTYLFDGDYNGGTSQDTWYARMYIYIYDSLGALKSSTLISERSIIPTSHIGNYYTNSVGGSVSYTGSFTLDDGDTMRLNWRFDPTDPGQQNASNFVKFTEDTTIVQVDVETVLPEVEIPAYTVKDLFSKLVDEISPGSLVSSTFLDNLSSDEMPLLVSGDAIRGISSPKIKVSLADLFDSIHFILGIGLGVETIGGVEVVVIEDMDYFYDDSIGIEFTSTRNLSIKTDTDSLIKTLDTGYSSQEYKELNGRDEFNSEQQWRFPLTKINTGSKFMSVIRADMYGIDNMRINYHGSTSDKDTKSDNNVFIVDSEYDSTVAGIDYYIVSRDKFTHIYGVNNTDTAYNMYYSPKRCLLRNEYKLAAALWKNSGSIELVSWDKNVSLQTSIHSGSIVYENLPISASQVTEKWVPLLFTFETTQHTSLWNSLINDAKKLITFSYNGDTYYGWLLEAAVNADHREIINVKLIAWKTNTFTNLI